mgnify:CR=1 FL=1
MSYSKLQHDIEIMRLNHKHDLQLLEMQHKNDLSKLTNSCNHMYEDGSSARTFQGDQRDNWYLCRICNKTIK